MFFALAEGGIQLIPDGTLFVHIAIILLMIYVLNRTLFQPINKILDRRDSMSGGRSVEAEDMLRSVDAGLVQYERSMREARAEGYSLMEQERGEAVRVRQEKLAAMREEIKTATDAERQDIASQIESARMTIEQDAQRIAAEIGSRVLHRPIAA